MTLDEANKIAFDLKQDIFNHLSDCDILECTEEYGYWGDGGDEGNFLKGFEFLFNNRKDDDDRFIKVVYNLTKEKFVFEGDITLQQINREKSL